MAIEDLVPKTLALTLTLIFGSSFISENDIFYFLGKIFSRGERNLAIPCSRAEFVRVSLLAGRSLSWRIIYGSYVWDLRFFSWATSNLMPRNTWMRLPLFSATVALLHCTFYFGGVVPMIWVVIFSNHFFFFNTCE